MLVIEIASFFKLFVYKIGSVTLKRVGVSEKRFVPIPSLLPSISMPILASIVGSISNVAHSRLWKRVSGAEVQLGVGLSIRLKHVRL